MTEAYLDTNAVRDLFRHGTDREAQLRAGLALGVREGRLRVLTSLHALQELCSIAKDDWAQFRLVAEYVFDIAGPAVLQETGALADSEVRLGRPLRADERFVAAKTIQELRRACEGKTVVLRLSVQAGEHARASAERNRQLRADAWKALGEAGAEDPRVAVDDWAAQLHKRIPEWTRDELRERFAQLGLTGADEYPLENVPTLLNFWSFYMARISLQAGQQKRRIEVSDDADVHHFALACHADVFVSCDGTVKAACAALPNAVQPICMEEFARRFLGMDMD